MKQFTIKGTAALALAAAAWMAVDLTHEHALATDAGGRHDARIGFIDPINPDGVAHAFAIIEGDADEEEPEGVTLMLAGVVGGGSDEEDPDGVTRGTTAFARTVG